MSLVPERRYQYEFGQNTYHFVERGEKSFHEQSSTEANAHKHAVNMCKENVGESFENIYDNLYSKDPSKLEFVYPHLKNSCVKRPKPCS